MKIIFAGNWRAQIELRLKQLAGNRNLAPIFVPLRNLVWTVIAIRNFLKPQKPYRAPLPVISVGNITVGGTGKTPFVNWLSHHLVKIGHKPAILTPLSRNADEVREHMDESLSKSGMFMVLPGRDRVTNIKRAIEQGATVVVLDDGFQFRSLHRDVDIVLWDATSQLFTNNPFLREPLSGLRRATCIVMSKADVLSEEVQKNLKQKIERWSGQGKVIAAFGYEPAKIKTSESDSFQARKVLLVAGVANPNYFLVTAQKAGFKTETIICFPDHHFYSLSDVKLIAKIAESEGVEAVLTTQKDAVKLHEVWQSEIPLLALKVKLKWLWGENKLHELVEHALL
ncbi:MAG: tetraacyldisaccharide 4'-kinase [Armatimonadetes bacterium]|nr:tetraacyldisaccharide 4'-kinase [Armatimonadota bacterium]